VKRSKEHIGLKIKRLRAFRGLTQEDLARSLGKTRSLVSFFERTGNINKYTLQEISSILNITPDQLEGDKFEFTKDPTPTNMHALSKDQHIVQLEKEIGFLKETINHQWGLLKELSKGK
jgi:transcriptional regulator with XRE-family HTH domain